MRTKRARRRHDERQFCGLLCPYPAIRAAAPDPLPARVRIDCPDDIGGVVTGATGPEAGVWVIAETADLPTRFVKIVVTDDQGRYVLPEMPKANYDIGRGYGLIESPKAKAQPERI